MIAHRVFTHAAFELCCERIVAGWWVAVVHDSVGDTDGNIRVGDDVEGGEDDGWWIDWIGWGGDPRL